MEAIKRLGSLAAVAMLSVMLAYAAPDKSKPAKTATPRCPVCKENLVTKKDTMHSVAVKVNGKTFYACPRGAAAITKKAAKAVKPGAACESCPHSAKGSKDICPMHAKSKAK